ncbi:MAG: hypothetical protein K5664_06975 [Firmicutes bacterium]|nr:hypothetical protein [Bacillota bacterium]
MSKKKKVLKVLIWIISIICVLLVAVVIGAYSYFKFYLAPKITPGGENSSENTAISFTEVAKELSDKQVLDNIINFDKQSASEMLTALNEIETEIEVPKTPAEPEKKEENKSDVKVPNEGKTAYERIMNEASKDEISQGMAIISKVDISKVTELRKQGKNSEIKEYIKSVLTSSEISAALKLYNKYKHLL